MLSLVEIQNNSKFKKHIHVLSIINIVLTLIGSTEKCLPNTEDTTTNNAEL